MGEVSSYVKRNGLWEAIELNGNFVYTILDKKIMQISDLIVSYVIHRKGDLT